MYAGDFAIVAEGYTDQLVISALLKAIFSSKDDLVVNFEQPPTDASGEQFAPGGWTLVVDYLKSGKFKGALQTNRYLVVHVDADAANELGIAGLRDGDLVTAIEAKLTTYIEPALIDQVRGRVAFAIGVDTIECWLLPLVFDRSQKLKLKKTSKCIAEIDHELRKRKEATLGRKDGGKNPETYRRLTKDLSMKEVDRMTNNAGVAKFVQTMVALTF